VSKQAIIQSEGKLPKETGTASVESQSITRSKSQSVGRSVSQPINQWMDGSFNQVRSDIVFL